MPNIDDLPVPEGCECTLQPVTLACSSMVKDVYLLRAFEKGADAVLVLVCPEGACRYVEGNIRAKKRVGLLKKLLDDIGLDGRRLALRNINHNDAEETAHVLQSFLKTVTDLGPSPAA